ncbi:type IV pili methyl-accepting chemotaxis transducer N-terminal domain-containing protein [Pseudomonas sp. sp1636]|uniref:type IV pili methyl-accepting chemotaxis transducer N-terminal domain-containing protein n=1 Tax=Pseudomonas sp. sp1636 TaxID=3036707 RepID=UPI0025A616A4|nr:type IV pili methyl-accepting chemotaxis transducer N-terminal domain-containing protein [Pseudomonas sp. sp1636]MDM8349986.1 type IV pili methyl-accepting chemotaxis transducer N-terminal domain-containing protein [Pseudomonas sp. sp1636]
MRKKNWCGLLLSLVLLSPSVWAAIGTAEAVNLSGMQRMLSQRIAKNYLMIGAEVRPEQARQQLDESLARFESNLLALDDYASSPPIEQQLQRVALRWQEYRNLIMQHPEPDSAMQVLSLSDQLLAESEALVTQIERSSGARTAQLVNRSGRQRMLSQRIAKLYLALSWKLPDKELQTQFELAVDEFNQAMEELRAAPENNAAINTALAKASAQWEFSQRGFHLSEDARYVPTLISVTCETLLKQMDGLTRAYAELPL